MTQQNDNVMPFEDFLEKEKRFETELVHKK